MTYQFTFHPYQKKFRQPLLTHHGTWEIREGIIISLTNHEDKKALGEITTLPWFGSETHQQALEFCDKLGQTITQDTIYSIPHQLPACQFGFETALENLEFTEIQPQNIKYSYLLPTGEKALYQWQEIYQDAVQFQTDITFKWKIGVKSITEETQIFEKLCQCLPSHVKLRLDANGGLNLDEAKTWLSVTDEWGKVEFLEQPLLPEQFQTMLQLSQAYSTPLALDESIATLQQLKNCYHQGWRSIFVIKPAIAGSILELRQLFNQYSIDAVFSSVFESDIGRQKAIQLASELTNCSRAIGFGLNHWFD
ncbi:o-succinylbenzoate synthase [Aphanothece hegewaldii CCALA 016]|uniref:o-succinylbenzoate synthase n=1 Tax=Aphanothece hegewaldii CCALA 016 TaxID=2107694 RepID=A0A2T1M097_9CHRO|nr:o-succinylbenzoate synthase [Aphanothece hegewaldii]PSF38072.1 o-succinylbenzoate synthase [Aphanothece hegewaldii CCALA 016]